jgi:type III restriction enzyme
MKLVKYQRKAEQEMTRRFKNGSAKEVLQGPTGCGKTLIMGEIAIQHLRAHPYNRVVIVSFSRGGLAIQTVDELKNHYKHRKYKAYSLSKSQARKLKSNHVGILAYEEVRIDSTKTKGRLGRKSKYMEDFKEIMEETNVQIAPKGGTILLIVDECQEAAGTIRSQEIFNIINPTHTLFVSATPRGHTGNIYVIPESDPIDAGILRRHIVIDDKRYLKDIPGATQLETILTAAHECNKDLEEKYQNELGEGKIHHPLVLIQIPNTTKGAEIQADAEHFLKTELGVPAAHIASDHQDNEYNNRNLRSRASAVRYVFFKQKYGFGWDCPRAQTIVMLRDVKDEVVRKQVVGRIRRNVDRRQWTHPSLHNSYIFTMNEDTMLAVIEGGYDELPVHNQTAMPVVTLPFDLSSQYVRRENRGKLKANLSAVYAVIQQELTNYQFDFTRGKMNPSEWLAEQDIDLRTSGDRFYTGNEKMSVGYLSVEDESRIAKEVLNGILRESPFKDIKSNSTPFREMIYKWLRTVHNIGHKPNEEERNWAICRNKAELIKGLTHALKMVLNNVPGMKEKYVPEVTSWELPVVTCINLTAKAGFKKYSHDRYYDREGVNFGEAALETELEKNPNIKWFYNNYGVHKQENFGVVYQKGIGNSKTFYPDYIACNTNGELIILEVKSAGDDSQMTKNKSQAFFEYVRKHNQDHPLNRLYGGFVKSENSNLYINQRRTFKMESIRPSDGWEILDLGNLK